MSGLPFGLTLLEAQFRSMAGTHLFGPVSPLYDDGLEDDSMTPPPLAPGTTELERFLNHHQEGVYTDRPLVRSVYGSRNEELRFLIAADGYNIGGISRWGDPMRAIPTLYDKLGRDCCGIVREFLGPINYQVFTYDLPGPTEAELGTIGQPRAHRWIGTLRTWWRRSRSRGFYTRLRCRLCGNGQHGTNSVVPGLGFLCFRCVLGLEYEFRQPLPYRPKHLAMPTRREEWTWLLPRLMQMREEDAWFFMEELTAFLSMERTVRQFKQMRMMVRNQPEALRQKRRRHNGKAEAKEAEIKLPKPDPKVEQALFQFTPPKTWGNPQTKRVRKDNDMKWFKQNCNDTFELFQELRTIPSIKLIQARVKVCRSTAWAVRACVKSHLGLPLTQAEAQRIAAPWWSRHDGKKEGGEGAAAAAAAAPAAAAEGEETEEEEFEEDSPPCTHGKAWYLHCNECAELIEL